MMMLGDLIQETVVQEVVGKPPSFLEMPILGVTQDSRRVGDRYLFVAIPGSRMDGHRFVREATRRGASAVVVQKAATGLSIPQIVVPDSRRALAEISARFYNEPSRRLGVIGITGTNGKTTLTYLIESILTAAGRRPAVFGTINDRFCGKILPADNTTPESVDLQRLMSEVLAEGGTDLVMEVSSHALSLDRVRGVHFDVAAFTNLSQDHLDFHQDIEEYFQAKLKFFSEILPASCKEKKFGVVNMEDPRAESVCEKVSGGVIRTGLTGPYEVSSLSFRLSADGITARVRAGSDLPEIRSALLGRFNLENILVAIGIARALEISPKAIVEGIEAVRSVPGRLERIANDRGVLAFVDYAHTPDALARVGENLKKYATGRVITVFGCGGDRDRTKRSLMGKEAALFSDLLIVTSDNPRTEEPDRIIDEILVGIEEAGYPAERVCRVASREEAIEKGVSLARRGDLILVAGKGHEDYQIVGTSKIPFSDRETLIRLFQK